MTGEYLLAQGILGFTTAALAGIIAYLYRQMNGQRKQYDDAIVDERARHNKEMMDERTRHAVEIAAERKLNSELQDMRVRELRTSLETVSRVSDSVDAALAMLSGRKA
ncbi:MAG: hypothetical protein DI537_20240 [Stutzerimonas stutzeri]|nr:MAG: hypothetical protein DI537_20240 [Stutzerimonas stutzeri]